MRRRLRPTRELRRSMLGGRPGCTRPAQALRASRLLRAWGPTSAAACELAAKADPDRAAIIDPHATITFRELNARTIALAGALAARGVGPTDTLAIHGASHHWCVEAQIAASRLGANLLLLGSDVPEERLHTLLAAQQAAALIEDGDEDLLARGPRVLLARAAPYPGDAERLEDLVAEGTRFPGACPHVRPTVTLAFEEEGSWKELRRPAALTAPFVAGCAIPIARGERTLIVPPISTPWGHLHLSLAMRLASTIVLPAARGPLATLAASERHQVSALALLRSQLIEIVELPAATRNRYRTPRLRVIAVKGASIPASVALPAMAHFGPVLYNRAGPALVTIDRLPTPAFAGAG